MLLIITFLSSLSCAHLSNQSNTNLHTKCCCCCSILGTHHQIDAQPHPPSLGQASQDSQGRLIAHQQSASSSLPPGLLTTILDACCHIQQFEPPPRTPKMCYQLVELYSACRCLYYQHAVDRCSSYGRPGHGIQSRTILVGYACSEHSSHHSAGYDYSYDQYSDSGHHSSHHSSRSSKRSHGHYR